MDGGRNSAQYSSRRLSANSKPRVSSTHLDDAELRPSDSASNAPTRRSASQVQKMSPSLQDSFGRRTERTNVNTKESYRVRTKTTIRDGGITESQPTNGAPKQTPPSPSHAPRINGLDKRSKEIKTQGKCHFNARASWTDSIVQGHGSLKPL